MTVLIDPPGAAGHGRLWSHLVSDTSFEELHAFARRLGLPERGFDRDHYDLPEQWYERAVTAGAVPVSSRELLLRLRAGGLRRPKHATPAPRRPGRPLLRPPRLHPGDAVALVAPAGRVDPARLRAGREVLSSWGFQVRGPGPESGDLPWLAGDDDDRAAAFTAAWTDPEVRAVVATRGGFGSGRVAALLDWDELAAAGPKVLLGFSDLTALHQAMAARLGLVTVHGPVAAGLGDPVPAAREWCRSLLTGATPEWGALEPVVAGSATGVLVGGNLTTLAATVGTANSYPGAGGIVVLEDVAEPPYRLDRMLTQLVEAGWFADAAGVVLGDFTDCGDPAQVRDLLGRRLGALGVPVAAGAPIGHGALNLAIPLGVRAALEVGPESAELVLAHGLR